MADKILVLNGAGYASSVDNLGYITTRVDELFEKPEEFKLILFTGGADVDPRFYNDRSPQRMCSSNPSRDMQEISVFRKAVKHGILMAGICRGVQFLNVMNGGKMMHHLDNHAGSVHLMELMTGQILTVNSLHHQMVILPEDAKLVGWAKDRLSRRYYGANDEVVNYNGAEVEAAIFPKTKSFGVQYHPEMMDRLSDGYVFFNRMVEAALEVKWDVFIKLYTKGSKEYEPFEISKPHNGSARAENTA